MIRPFKTCVKTHLESSEVIVCVLEDKIVDCEAHGDAQAEDEEELHAG